MADRDTTAWHGIVRVAVMRPGQPPRFATFRNRLTDAGLNLMRDLLIGAIADGRVRYVALGLDDTPPADGDVALGAEIHREAVTVQTAEGIGEAFHRAFIDTDEANVAIRELGWYATPAATAAVDSGVLVARVLYTHDKDAGESLYVERTDQFVRGA